MKRLRRLRCWWTGFYGTWLLPGTWATRFRLLLTPGGHPLSWPGIIESGHWLDTDTPRFEVREDQEHEWMTCARCGTEVYTGWREWRAMR